MARGYAAVGDNKKALKYAQEALTQAPDDFNKKSINDLIQSLNEGNGVN